MTPVMPQKVVLAGVFWGRGLQRHTSSDVQVRTVEGLAYGPGALTQTPSKQASKGVEVAPCEEAESSLRVDCGLQADLQEELVLEKYRHTTGISYRETERERALQTR